MRSDFPRNAIPPPYEIIISCFHLDGFPNKELLHLGKDRITLSGPVLSNKIRVCPRNDDLLDELFFSTETILLQLSEDLFEQICPTYCLFVQQEVSLVPTFVFLSNKDFVLSQLSVSCWTNMCQQICQVF